MQYPRRTQGDHHGQARFFPSAGGGRSRATQRPISSPGKGWRPFCAARTRQVFSPAFRSAERTQGRSACTWKCAPRRASALRGSALWSGVCTPPFRSCCSGRRANAGPLGEHALIGLQKELRGEAFALLNEAIVGGLMGGYAEEGFPLYYINDQMLSCLGYTMQEFLEATGGRMTGCIHPKDRIQAERAAQKCAAQDEICAVRCRMVKKDGGVFG